MTSESYKRELDNMTLSELQIELEKEQDALNDMENDGGGYEGYSNMLQAAREHIDYINELIAEKS